MTRAAWGGAPVDPTAVITISGGRTSVDTDRVLAQARVLRDAAGQVDDAVARANAALHLLGGGFGGSALRSWPDSGYLGPEPWSPALAAARSAAQDAVRTAVGHLHELSAVLVDVADRMLKAVGLYGLSETAAEHAARTSGMDAFFATVASWPGMGLHALFWKGSWEVAGGLLRGEGLQPGLYVTATGDVQEAAMRSTSAALGLADPDRDLLAAPGVANGAAVLRLLSQPHRGLYRDDVLVTPLVGEHLPDDVDLPAPRTAEDLLRRIDTVYGKDNSLPHSVVAVEEIAHDDGTRAWVVTIPGTQLGRTGTPFGMTSNYDLVSGELSDSAQLVLGAMAHAGIDEDDEVVLVGHSQGGMVAAAVAAAVSGPARDRPRYAVSHVVTAGAPIGGVRLPDGVRGTHVENRQEGVSNLDGRPNVATPDQVTVHADATRALARGEVVPPAVPHGVPHHVQTLTDARGIGHAGLAENLAAVERSVAGERVATRYYRGTLVPDPTAALSDAGRLVTRSTLPTTLLTVPR
ncbi:hypothetical protein [Oerskovia flava]|uniref:hypothetical protein n=1 Tax=Oerskovia flava TaxID=2986422 RepID=UPI00223FA2F2|nr:hypothetical protein [Oerskovia sp. JB1-3-2]